MLLSLTKCDRDGINHHIGWTSDCGKGDPFHVSYMRYFTLNAYDCCFYGDVTQL